MKKSGLGRGLDALLPSLDQEPATPGPQEIPVRLLDPNPNQPRKSFSQESLNALAESIRSAGMIQPILAMETNGRYRIVAGERRFRAAKLAGLATVPVIVREFEADQLLEIALIENLQREDLNPIEEAQAIRDLMDQCHYTQEAASARLGMSRPSLANTLRLLELPGDIRAMIASGQISAGHGRVLCGISDPEKRASLAQLTIEKGLNVRQLEALAAGQKKTLARKQDKKIALEIRDLEEKLCRRLGMKTTITGTENSGKILIRYSSRNELETLLEWINQ